MPNRWFCPCFFKKNKKNKKKASVVKSSSTQTRSAEMEMVALPTPSHPKSVVPAVSDDEEDDFVVL